MTLNFKRIAAVAAGILTATATLMAQQQSTATLSRKSTSERNRKEAQADGPKVTDRMQAHYEADGKSITDADRQWMRVIYRHLDLDKDKNAALYFPEEIVDGQENLFRIIMRLLANNQLAAYEYLDGREVFTDQYRLKVSDLLDRFHILYTNAKGSTERNPRYTIEEADVPTNEVLSYYVIERWEFDTRSNRMKTIVEAICPVLHRSGDFGGEAVKYPMFWVKYDDLRPWLANQAIFISDDNNLPTCTYDDYFRLTLYDGDIYKTRNLRNKSMVQLYPEPDDLARAQDSIQNSLTNFDKKLWVPDREDVIASKEAAKEDKKSSAKADENVVATGDPATDEALKQAAEQNEDKSARRSTSRSSKKSSTKVKQKKVKTQKSVSRSVRRRK